MNEVEKAELNVLFALFVEHHVRPEQFVDLDEIYQRYNLKFPTAWLESSTSDWEGLGWVEAFGSKDGTAVMLNGSKYNSVLKRLLSWLNASSLTVDAKKEEILSDHNPTSDTPMINGWKWFTYASEAQGQAASITQSASADALVRFDTDEPQYGLVKEGITQLAEAVRSVNDLPGGTEERQRILGALSAAATLWDTAQLRAIQIKVGVMLAIEDAGRALAGTAKAVAIAVFVDAIKSIVKNHAGVDLDKL